MNGISTHILPQELQNKHNLIDDRKTAYENSIKKHNENKDKIDKTRKELVLCT
ncbi:hypothetical protein PGB90_009283 [Kerria lacca]